MLGRRGRRRGPGRPTATRAPRPRRRPQCGRRAPLVVSVATTARAAAGWCDARARGAGSTGVFGGHTRQAPKWPRTIGATSAIDHDAVVVRRVDPAEGQRAERVDAVQRAVAAAAHVVDAAPVGELVAGRSGEQHVAGRRARERRPRAARARRGRRGCAGRRPRRARRAPRAGRRSTSARRARRARRRRGRSAARRVALAIAPSRGAGRHRARSTPSMRRARSRRCAGRARRGPRAAARRPSRCAGPGRRRSRRRGGRAPDGASTLSSAYAACSSMRLLDRRVGVVGHDDHRVLVEERARSRRRRGTGARAGGRRPRSRSPARAARGGGSACRCRAARAAGSRRGPARPGRRRRSRRAGRGCRAGRAASGTASRGWRRCRRRRAPWGP